MHSKETAYNKLSRSEPIKDIVFDTFGYFDLQGKNYSSIEFINCVFNDRVLFSNYNEEINLLSFENCTFSNVFSIDHLKYVHSLEIDNCKIKKSLSLKDISGHSFTIHNSTLNKFSIDSSEIDSIEVIDTDILNQCDLINIKSPYVNLSNRHRDKNYSLLRINSLEIQNLYVDFTGNINTLKLFRFKNAEINCAVSDLSIHMGDFEQLSIGVTSHDKKAENSRIGNLSLVNLKQFGNIRIHEVFIRDLTILDVDATAGNYFFSEVVIENVSIDGSIFSKFYCNCNLP